MSYQLSQEQGRLDITTVGNDLYQALVAAGRMVQATMTKNVASEDATALGADYTSMMQGLSDYTIEVEALYPTTAPRYGNQAFITFASGYVPYVRGFTLNFDYGELDITTRTASDGTALNARLFRPNHRPIVTGSFSTLVANASIPLAATGVNAAAAAAVFKIAEGGAADPSFTGDIRTTGRRGPTIGPAGVQVVEYDFQFSGQVTSVAGTTGTPAILPAGAVNGADWDLNGDGVADIAFDFFPNTGAASKYAGFGFLRSLTVNVEADAPIRMNATIRGTGEIVNT
jgi:hypothetical protein